MLHVKQIEKDSMHCMQVTLKDWRHRVYEDVVIPMEVVQSKGIVQHLEDINAHKALIDACRKYADEGG